MASEFFGKAACRFHTAGCGNKMVVSVCDWAYGEVNELGGPVIPGTPAVGS